MVYKDAFLYKDVVGKWLCFRDMFDFWDCSILYLNRIFDCDEN